MAQGPKDPKDIVSFNQELMSFDVADMSLEELERRLELAVAQIAVGSSDCPGNCPPNCDRHCEIVCLSNCVILAVPTS